jgi:N-carbamoyl-L-amino-acid hydrolase
VRRCLTEIDLESRRWLVEQLQAAGLAAQIDGIGNVIGLSANPGKALLLGSHSDTQPTGGWLDGALGVIYALEVSTAFGEHEATRKLAVDVASWADEESHYLGMMGSRSFCGELTEVEIDAASNDAGETLREALTRTGLAGRPRLTLERERYLGYIEAHIEQGPWLEAEHKCIGVVTSIIGMCDLGITIRGQQNHAGTTPMHLRRDAAQTLFEFCRRIDAAFAAICGEHTVWTVGQIGLQPNARSIVPGLTTANLQFRDPDQATVERLRQCAFDLAHELDRESVCEIEIHVHDDSARAVDMDTGIRQALADSAELLVPGKWRYMPSGAAHDAQVIAAHLPAGMLFIPSIGGISHDFAEDSSEKDIVLGCEVLAETALKLLTANED